MTRDAYINRMAEECIKQLEWAAHPTGENALALVDLLAERLLLLKQIKEQEE